MTENELAEKNAQFAKGVMELAFRMGYVTRDEELVRCKDCKHYRECEIFGKKIRTANTTTVCFIRFVLSRG